MMKGPEQIGFKVHYPRPVSTTSLESLRDRLEHALPNFGRKSNGIIRILVCELSARMSLYPRPKPARDCYQLIVMIERLRLVAWGISRKDPIWVQFRARHPGPHISYWVRRPELKIAIGWKDVSRLPRLHRFVTKGPERIADARRTEHDCYPPYLQRLTTR